MDHRKIALLGAAAVAASVLVWALVVPASAADLGGDCCADLEERIAELEATTARKGNRKVSLEVSGQINAALVSIDTDGYSNTEVRQNGNEESRIKFSGGARINSDMAAGYTIEIESRDLGLLGLPLGGDGLRVRQSYWHLKSEKLGKVSVGKTAQATQGFDEITTANTAVANKANSLGALSDAYLTGIDIPFDGQFRDVIRYDSPNWMGFTVSASWGSSFDILDSEGNGNNYDVALRFADEYAGFKVAGGLGYRVSTDLEINLLNIASIAVPTGDVDTILATGSVMHLGTGLFVTGNYADQDYDTFDFSLKGYAVTAGIERKWNSLGATTLYGEFNRFELETGGGSGEIDVYGAGIVQAIDAAAMDLYLTYRNYDLGDLGGDDLQAVTTGARIRF